MSKYNEILMQHIDENLLVEMTKELVRIPSYEGVQGQETKTAEHIKALFDKEGIPAHIEEVQDGRFNVYALLKGSGNGKTLMLSGHMDTVSPENHPRGLDPYLEDGKLVGRGTADMKGALACMIGAMRAIKRSGIVLGGDILFVGVIDEEMKSLGTIDALEKGYRADGVIVGEPTELQVHLAQRGLEWYEFTFTGKTVHGGRQREGINAIDQARKFMNVVMDELSPQIFSRKHPLLVESTLNIAVIHGGTGLSTVPGLCKLYIDRRFLPNEDFEQIGNEFQAIIDRLSAEDPDFKCEMKPDETAACKTGYMHVAFETSKDEPIVVSARKGAEAVVGYDAEPVAHVAWTDAALFSVYGKTPAIIMGPGAGVVCHSEYEYVPVAHLTKACLEYALTAIDFCR